MGDLLDVGATLRGRKILFIGATGFVGKVALSLLLHRYPDLGTLFVLTRAGAGSSSDERFFDKIASSPVFDPVRELFGGNVGFLAFMRDKCVALPGDVSRPLLNFSAADLDRLGQLDLIVNCAGLVTFNPHARERDPHQRARPASHARPRATHRRPRGSRVDVLRGRQPRRRGVGRRSRRRLLPAAR